MVEVVVDWVAETDSIAVAAAVVVALIVASSTATNDTRIRGRLLIGDIYTINLRLIGLAAADFPSNFSFT